MPCAETHAASQVPAWNSSPLFVLLIHLCQVRPLAAPPLLVGALFGLVCRQYIRRRRIRDVDVNGGVFCARGPSRRKNSRRSNT